MANKTGKAHSDSMKITEGVCHYAAKLGSAEVENGMKARSMEFGETGAEVSAKA